MMVVLAFACMQPSPHSREKAVEGSVRDTAGLRRGIRVTYAGVEVGVVTGIRHVDNAAYVSIRLTRADVPLSESDRIRRYISILGLDELQILPSHGKPLALGGVHVLGDAPTLDAGDSVHRTLESIRHGFGR
jgi:ABC-type transporter Mla subunit MlaD